MRTMNGEKSDSMVTASDGTVTATLSPRYGFAAPRRAFSVEGDGSDGEIPTPYIHRDSFLPCLLWRWNKRKKEREGSRGVCVQSSGNAVIAVTAVTGPKVLGPTWPQSASAALETVTDQAKFVASVRDFGACRARLCPVRNRRAERMR